MKKILAVLCIGFFCISVINSNFEKTSAALAHSVIRFHVIANNAFSSIPFLYYFLPAVILVYFPAPKELRNTVLLLFSLLFYGWGSQGIFFL